MKASANHSETKQSRASADVKSIGSKRGVQQSVGSGNNGGVAQCVVSVSNHVNDPDGPATIAYENALDTAVQNSYQHIVAAPSLGAQANIDGHTTKWAATWATTMANNAPVPSLYRDFGYAVESLTTSVYLPPPPAGMSHVLQGTRGATRPDIILLRSGADVAWLDITAHSSAGHIHGKAGWNNMKHHSEITYPSVHMGTVHTMVGNNAQQSPLGFNANAMKAKIDAAQQLHNSRRMHWNGTCANSFAAFYATRRQSLFDGIRFKRMAEENEPGKYKCEPAVYAILRTFNLGDAKKGEVEAIAGSIIHAMGYNSGNYGFMGGVNLATGEAFLLENDPNLPQPPAVAVPDQAGGISATEALIGLTLALGALGIYYLASLF